MVCRELVLVCLLATVCMDLAESKPSLIRRTQLMCSKTGKPQTYSYGSSDSAPDDSFSPGSVPIIRVVPMTDNRGYPSSTGRYPLRVVQDNRDDPSGTGRYPLRVVQDSREDPSANGRYSVKSGPDSRDGRYSSNGGQGDPKSSRYPGYGGQDSREGPKQSRYPSPYGSSDESRPSPQRGDPEITEEGALSAAEYENAKKRLLKNKPRRRGMDPKIALTFICNGGANKSLGTDDSVKE